MRLLNLKLTRFGLFKEASIILQSINLITGKNLDNPNQSGNGSAKSTLGKLAIIFLLYGEGCGKKLERLIHFGTKKAIVEGEIEHRGNIYKIVRCIPNSLQVYVNGELKDFNTATIAQEYLNKTFGNYEFFRKFCLIDNKGINLLDSLGDMRSIVSFKKELVSFIDEQFAPIRESLLAKKNNCETYSIDRRLYKFYLSDKRLKTLEDGLNRLNEELENTKKEKEEQQETVNKVKINIETTEDKLKSLELNKDNNMETFVVNNDRIEGYNKQINELKTIEIKAPEKIDYDTQIFDKEKEITIKENDLKELLSQIDTINNDIKTIEINITQYNSDIKNYKKGITELTYKSVNVGNAKSGIKCDECGAVITEDNKANYQTEKKQEIDKNQKEIDRLSLLLDTTNVSLLKLKKQKSELEIKKREIEINLSELRGNLRVLNTKKNEQEGIIKGIEQKEIERTGTITKYNELINTYKKQNEDITKQNKELDIEIRTLSLDIPKQRDILVQEESCMKYYNSLYEAIQSHIVRAREKLLKLKEAFKFSSYKYTLSDIQLYTDSIKTLDNFSGFYISEWINNLKYIINDLLQPVNLSIELTDSKEFIKIKDGEQELYYSDLSDGQKNFLSSVFKLGILMQKGEQNRIIIMDDGLGALDEINFKNLMTICQSLPMQYFCIYQNAPILENINYINVERKNNISIVK